jgi:hypothetical protein
MATVQLADVYEPLTFNQAVQESAIELNAFYQSGVLAADGVINQMADVGGTIGELPFYLGLTNDEPNYSNDNPAATSTPAKVASGKQIFRKAMMNKSWSTMDLARELALSDPLAAITNRVGHYWSTMLNRRVIQTAMGVLGDNAANDSGDMVYSIATDDAGAVTVAEQISADAVIQAAGTLGDHAGKLSVIAMHSVVYQRLQSQNLIDFIQPSVTSVSIPTYLGYRVVVDDSMPAIAGVNRITYTTVLFSTGAFAYGMGTPTVPSEIERKPDTGNGGGQEILYSRRTDIIHPYGFEFTSSSVAGQSPTEAELATTANWDRVYAERKNIGMAFLQTNG